MKKIIFDCVCVPVHVSYIQNGKYSRMPKTSKILHNLVNHTFDPVLRNKIWQWLVAPSNQKEKEEALLSIWEEYPTEATADTYRSLKATQEKIKQIKSPQKQYNPVQKLLKIAAILIIPLLSIIGSYLYIQYNTYNPELIQCFVPEGENQNLTLPDGSMVNINSGSILIYPKEFKGDTRTLYLTGEANFTVKKDAKHPFIVYTGYLNVQALGTKFNVQAYSESDKIITTLENGIIKVDKTIGGEDSFILSPNEQLEYNHKTGEFQKRRINATYYSGWTKGELNFINQSLKEILSTLQRGYAVDFIINPRLLTPDLYTIKFRQHEDIETVMKILTMTVGGLGYEIKDNIITIYSLKKKGVK